MYVDMYRAIDIVSRYICFTTSNGELTKLSKMHDYSISKHSEQVRSPALIDSDR